MSEVKEKGLSISVPKHHVMALTVEHFLEYQAESSSHPLRVVDVRNIDFVGGHIPVAIHMPYSDFDSKHLKLLIDQCQNDKIERIVFYCMYSAERAPACAQLFLSTFEHTHPQDEPPMVCVLTGGMCGYVNYMIADFEPSLWASVIEQDSRRIVYRGDLDASIAVPISRKSGAATPKAGIDSPIKK